jgi:Rod binding domain-containing protein
VLSVTSAALPDAAVSQPAGQSSSTKLHTAAQQFEALMIGELLKTARADDEDGALGEGEDSGADSAMDMAQSQFATALANRGGLGLAPIIEKTMSRTPHTQQASEIVGAAVTGSQK